MSSRQVIPILDEESLRAMLDELLVARLEEMGQELVERLSPAPLIQPSMQPMLTVSDLAKLLHVDPKTVYRWRDDGTLPPCVKVGGILRWDAAVIRGWIAERSSDPESS